jgi:hypothetical protein
MVSKKKYKITYWLCGNKRVATIEATSKYNAKVQFYLSKQADDIISIEEVTE